MRLILFVYFKTLSQLLFLQILTPKAEIDFNGIVVVMKKLNIAGVKKLIDVAKEEGIDTGM